MFRNMLRYFTTISILITAFGYCQSAVAQTCVHAPVDLTSWWSADGNALDSRSRNNGTLIGNAGFAAGQVGQAFNLDGNNDSVQIPHNNNLNINGSFTAEAWIFPRSFPNLGPRILDNDEDLGTRWLLALNNDASGVNTLTVVINSSFLVAPSNSILLNQWSHVAFTYSGTTGDLRLFINGVQAAFQNIGVQMVNNNAPLRIGDDLTGTREFDGLIDEPAIYNRALSASELLAIFNAGTAGKCKPTATVAPAGLVSWWAGDGHFNDIQSSNSPSQINGSPQFNVARVGQGIKFDGNSGLIVSDNPTLNFGTNSFSLEMWMRIDALPAANGAVLFEKRNNLGQGYVLSMDNTGFSFTARGNGGAVTVQTSPVSVGGFHHLAISVDRATSNNVTFYLDGVAQSVSPSIAGIGNTDNSGRLFIGQFSADSGTSAAAFNGVIDEASLYNRALTGAEITSIFNAGLAGKLKTATTATGANVGTNTGSDATITFPNVTTAGTTQQIPLDTAILPTLPAGFTHTGLAYDIATSATPSGSINISFHLPSFNSQSQFSFLKVLHLEGGAFVDRTIGQDFTTRTLTATVSSLSPFVISNGASPTAVTLAWFTATGFDDGRVLLEWQTGFEADNLGFNVYREESGRRTLITPSLIAGSALLAGARTVLTAGQAYVWADTVSSNPQPRYWLEDIDLKGKSVWHGPVAIRFSKTKSPSLAQAELLARVGWRQAIAVNGTESTPLQSVADMPRFSPEPLASQSDLAAKPAVKLSVKREGWYRVTQPELIRAGIPASVDPRLLSMFVDGKEISIKVTGEMDGRLDQNDAVEFYGLGLDTASTDTRVYWLVASTRPGLRASLVSNASGIPAPPSFAFTVERKDRSVYFPALRNGDDENFFGAVIATQPVDQSLFLNWLNPSSGNAQVTVEVALQGVTLLSHRVKVEVNGVNIGTIVFQGQSQGKLTMHLAQALFKEGENVVRLTAQGGSGDISLINFIRITYQRGYVADSNSLRFSASGTQQVTINGFTKSDIRIFDVTDSFAVLELSGVVRPQKAGYSVTITAPETGQRNLLALTSDQFGRPVSISANIPSSWRQAANAADLVIITRRDFFRSLDRLRAHRQSQGLKVAVVDVEDIYDEFSFGQKTPLAIKEFLLYWKGNWKKAPRFVLMAADSSFDPRNYLGFGDTDLVPTKLVDTQLMETASDDWLADFDRDGLAEMSVGRLPAKTTEEAATMVEKIIGYESSTPSEEMLLVADANDGFDFEGASYQLSLLVPSSIRINQINRGRVDDETARMSLHDTLERGQKIVNYTGHGSVQLWRGNLLTSEDARALHNEGHLPVFVMMTCLNGYFHDAAIDSLAESLMKAERGGAVAVWASSGMTLPDGQAHMNRELYRLLLNQDRAITLGEAIMKAKASLEDADIRGTWILLGDPTTRLR